MTRNVVNVHISSFSWTEKLSIFKNCKSVIIVKSPPCTFFISNFRTAGTDLSLNSVLKSTTKYIITRKSNLNLLIIHFVVPITSYLFIPFTESVNTDSHYTNVWKWIGPSLYNADYNVAKSNLKLESENCLSCFLNRFKFKFWQSNLPILNYHILSSLHSPL